MPAYIKFPSIPGEVNDADHSKWVAVESVSLPIFRTITENAVGQARSGGTTSLGDVVVVKNWDSSTPLIAKACADGEFMDEVEIHLCSKLKGKNVPNLEVKLSNVVISGYSWHGTADQNPTPTEEITLNYTKINWNYNKYDVNTGEKDTNVPAEYDSEQQTSG